MSDKVPIRRLPTGVPAGLCPKSGTPSPNTSFNRVKCRSRRGFFV